MGEAKFLHKIFDWASVNSSTASSKRRGSALCVKVETGVDAPAILTHEPIQAVHNTRNGYLCTNWGNHVM